MQKTKKNSIERTIAGKSCLALLEYLQHPAWIYCPDGKYKWVNDSFLRLLDVTREDLINKVNPDFICPDIAAKCVTSKQKILEKRCSLTFHFEEKDYRRVVYKTPIFSQHNEIIAIAGLLIDLTQEIELETELDHLKDFYQSVLSNMGEALLFISKKGEFKLINKKAEELLSEIGFNKPLDDDSWLQLFTGLYDKDEKKHPKAKEIFYRALQGEIVLNEEIHLEKLNDFNKTFRASAIPFTRKEDGFVLGVILTISDITQEKQLIEALAKKTKLAEQRNQELQQFSHSAAHDLRDPLRNISLSASLIYEKIKAQKYDELEDLLERMLKTTSYGSSLIKNLLDYSTAKRKMQMELVCLDEIVRQTIAGLGGIIEQSGAKITFTRLPVVLGNPQQLQIVFQNIISNAIHYKGKDPLIISISAHRKKSLWVISIKDNGPGVKEELKNDIFLPFKRLSSNSSGERSSGLGLSICQGIIEQHGGEIWLDTHLSPGSCFKFTLKGTD